MSGFSLPGGSFDVCCPGTSLHANDIEYCCVGSDDHEDRKVRKRVDICIGGAADCSSADATSSCVTAVPATAGDFSARVASATKTMDSESRSTGGSVNSAASSHGAAGSVITAAFWPAFAAAAGGVVGNAVLNA